MKSYRGKSRKLNVVGAVAAAVVVALLTLPAVARAATIMVNSLNDDTATTYCDLREAINSANEAASGTGNCTPGTGTDTIQFSLSGTITLSSALPAIANSSSGSLTIDGSGQAITLDGASRYRVMEVNPGAKLTVNNLTIADGNPAVAWRAAASTTSVR
jgi:hypothetical protein